MLICICMANNDQSGTIELNNKDEKSEAKAPPSEGRDELQALSEQSERVLYEARTFSIFHPSSIIIDREKINIIQKRWWVFQKKFPILIGDIKTVVANSALFFSEIRFEITGYEENPDVIRPFLSHVAIKTKRLILGLIIAKQEGLDLSKYSDEEVVKELEKIGRSHS